MSEEKRVGGVKRWLGRIVKLILVLVVLAAVLLFTGIPQKQLAERALGKALHSDVKISALSLWNKVKMGQLTALKKDAPGSTPSLELKDLEVDYALSAKDKRNITGVRIGSLQMQRERPRAAAAGKAEPPKKPAVSDMPTRTPLFRNLKFKMPQLDAQRFLPKTLEVGSLDFTQSAPSLGFGIAGPRLSVALSRRDDFTADVKGDNASVSWWAGSSSDTHKVPGTLNLHLEKHRGDIVLDPLQISFPGLLDVAGVFRVEKKNKDIQCNVNLEKAVAQDVDFTSADPADMKVLFGFQRLDLSGSKIQGPASFDKTGFKVSCPTIALKAVADGLRLGPKGSEFYNGPLNLELTGTPGDINLNLDASFNRGQKVHAGLTGAVTDLVTLFHLQDWSKEDLFALMPEKARAMLDGTPLTGLNSVDLETHLKLVNLEFKGAIRPALSQTQEPVELQAEGTIPVNMLLHGMTGILGMPWADVLKGISAKVADSSLTLTKQPMVKPPLKNHWAVSLENVSLGQWIQTFTGSALLANLFSPVTGKADLQANAGFETLELTLDLSQGLMMDVSVLRNLSAQSVDRPAERALLEALIAQFDGRVNQPLTAGTLNLSRKDGAISGELLLKNDTTEVKLPIIF